MAGGVAGGVVTSGDVVMVLGSVSDVSFEQEIIPKTRMAIRMDCKDFIRLYYWI